MHNYPAALLAQEATTYIKRLFDNGLWTEVNLREFIAQDDEANALEVALVMLQLSPIDSDEIIQQLQDYIQRLNSVQAHFPTVAEVKRELALMGISQFLSLESRSQSHITDMIIDDIEGVVSQTKNILRRVGIVSLSDFGSITLSGLKSIEGIGDTRLTELEEALEKIGLKLNDLFGAPRPIETRLIMLFSMGIITERELRKFIAEGHFTLSSFSIMTKSKFITEFRFLINKNRTLVVDIERCMAAANLSFAPEEA